MENSRTRAGQSTREMASRRYKARLWLVLPLAAVVLVALMVAFNANALGIGGLGMLGLIAISRLLMDLIESKARPMMKAEARAVRGAKAEEKIGSILESLGTDYMIVHDIESPFGNIDHVAFSREGGVFLIETKAHGGRVTLVNGQIEINSHPPEKDFVGQVLNNTFWLKERLKQATGLELWITPLLVFTNAFVGPIAPIKGITIINKRYLLGALEKKEPSRQNTVVWPNRDKIMAVLANPQSRS